MATPGVLPPDNSNLPLKPSQPEEFNRRSLSSLIPEKLTTKRFGNSRMDTTSNDMIVGEKSQSSNATSGWI